MKVLSCGSLSYLSKVPACGANNKMSYSGGVHSMDGTGAVPKNSILHNRNYIQKFISKTHEISVKLILEDLVKTIYIVLAFSEYFFFELVV